MRTVHADGRPAYDVQIGPGALSQLASVLPEARRLAVMVDENVERLHGDRIRKSLSDRHFESFVLPSGERHKTLRTAESVFDFLARHRFERGEGLVVIGGGVTGDLAGFVAATWLRGVPFVQVPTTLLAMVDSSVGGKVAVDLPQGKNLVGAFHTPRAVLADTSLLETLPEREVWSGLAEVVKTALLAGGPLMTLVQEHLPALAAGRGPVDEIVALCVEYKAGVTRRDPNERGERAVLNLGHTVGHALEVAGGFERLLHGEAVAHGLRATLALSGFASDRPEWRLVRALQAPSLEGFSPDAVLDAMRSDKKASGGRPRFVLLDDVGCPRWGCDVSDERVRDVVEKLIAARL